MLFFGIPIWYLVVAIVWSAYQGWRGYREQRLFTVDGKDGPAKNWKAADKFLVLYLHDFVFRFVCTMAGFVALLVCYRTVRAADLSAGSVALLAFSFLVGVIGVGGQLHTVILLGKLSDLPKAP